jgi:hypothetical protein
MATKPTLTNLKPSKSDNTELKYKGFFKYINKEPTDEYIEIFVSDWNKEHWGFYAHISQDDYETDIDNIQELITKLNYRDGDVYTELINHSDELKHFYKYLYDLGHYTQSDVLNPELWEILEEKGDKHFLYFSKLNGGSYIRDLQSFEYVTFEDWYKVLETFNPELYKALDENNGFGCFGIEHFFNCQNFHEIDGLIVEEVY